MKIYEPVARALCLPGFVVDLIAGRLKTTDNFEPVEDFTNWPPALIPIACKGIQVLGYWKHWFGEQPGTYVHYDPETEEVTEIARMPRQFIAHILAEHFEYEDGKTDEAQTFADRVGYVGIDKLCEESEDGLEEVSDFQEQTPLDVLDKDDLEDYDGHFPSGNFEAAYSWWQHATEFEGTDAMAWPDEIPKPQWLATKETPALFQNYLDNGQLYEAWLSLHCGVWSYQQARKALKQLTLKTRDPSLELLCEAFCHASREEDIVCYRLQRS